MRVLMLPHLKHFRTEESGIKRVVEAYFQHLPKYGIELVDEGMSHDLLAVHAGTHAGCDVSHSHGLYWTADYPALQWEWATNSGVIDNMRTSKAITVPSEWVAESIRRDMHRNPAVVPHGIDWSEWAYHDKDDNGYILWNKNRISDVCDPRPVVQLAQKFTDRKFVTTFAPPGDTPRNVNAIGLLGHAYMKEIIQGASVYLATVKETFGIGILEAMASGVPVLGYGFGGILDLVEHGVNGYLAQPGNVDDLSDGLAYCLKHGRVLGANGREMARAWTWEAAAEKVAAVYQEAGQDRPATVTVVVPAYNYADKIGRALSSIAAQTWREFECIVVDDGSTDGSETLIPPMLPDDRFRYVRQDNSGVAIARNRGISEGSGKYICCLDADDALEPEFLRVCVEALEEDRRLGIAYTALRYIKPDGEEGVSEWPGEWDFDAQLRRQNQVPTCCLFRRDMWEALGGYRARYCPEGAGTEDAEFWTRCGAYGWAAERVTAEPLFIYSWQSGRVSGNKEYSEVDWLSWHPWAQDEQHPFASYARPKKWSHPVRAYDEPAVSVVIPVGPGHMPQLVNALDSLEAQTFRKWEVICVNDTGAEMPASLLKAFPFVRWLDTGGWKGAGYARNRGVEAARGGMVLFLDADDWLYPEAIESMLRGWERTGSAIYTDYVGKAFIENVGELAPDLQERILWRDEGDGQTVIRYTTPDYDWQRAQRQPEGDKPWIWCNVTTLFPKSWHGEIGGFDETMESWEDVDYWYRMARAGKPFARIPEPLLVYQFYSGSRRDTGAKEYQKLMGYMVEKYKGVMTVPCKGCGGNRAASSPVYNLARQTTMPKVSGLDDRDLVMARYISPKRGSRMIFGSAPFEQRIEGLHMQRTLPDSKYRICYGHRGPGDEFLVHVRDLEMAPHLFQSVEVRGVVPEAAPTPPPQPTLIAPSEPEARPVRAKMPEEPRPIVPEDKRDPPDLGMTKDSGLEELDAAIDMIKERDNGRPTLGAVAALDLEALPGISPQIAKQLRADGVSTRDELLALGVKGLTGYKGVGPVKAELIIGAVGSLD